MTKAHRLFLLIIVCFYAVVGFGYPAYSQDKIWTDEDFAELGKPPTEPLPVGTVITQENWQKYKGYMPVALQVVFQGDHGFKLPPDYKIVVGPTSSFSMPKLFIDATRKYAGSASLVPAPQIGPGALVISGYQGGLPFPNPQEPDLGMKIEYNTWFAYTPAVLNVPATTYGIDRFHNRHEIMFNQIFGKTSYVTDEGYPEFDPLLPGIMKYTYTEILKPEQSRYAAALTLAHRDPADFPELYVFVPPLRRVLRLSPAAVCSPVLGTDVTNDDDCSNAENCQQVPLFETTLLGEKKLLWMFNMKPEAFPLDTANGGVIGLNPQYFYSSPAEVDALGWAPPKPSAGSWELRDVYVIAMRRLPSLRKGYCYGTRVFYVDKENWYTIMPDLWDAQQKYWKGVPNFYAKVPIPGTDTVIYGNARAYGGFLDFQTGHASQLMPTDTKVNKDAGKYGDTARYATPAGLQQIMQ